MSNEPLTALPRLSGCVQFMGTTATCRPLETVGRSENRRAGRSGALSRGVQRSRLCEPAWSPFLVTAYRLILSKISLLMESCASSNLKEMHCVGAGLVPARTAGDCGSQGGPIEFGCCRIRHVWCRNRASPILDGRPYEGECLCRPFNLLDALHQPHDAFQKHGAFPKKEGAAPVRRFPDMIDLKCR